jgi:hypothetical protein
MLDFIKQSLIGQYDAALCMLHQCLAACPGELYEGPIVSGSFRQIAYHMLFFVDLYLSPSKEAFVYRELHQRGGDELQPRFSEGLSQSETIEYLAVCRQKVRESIAAETQQSLPGPSGFSWYPVSRYELHLINIRHVQHHTGQFSAYLRRLAPALREQNALPWVSAGWR